MILLLGGSGYVGQAFATELQRRGWLYANVARAQLDYSRFDVLHAFLREHRPSFVVNCAGYTGKPNVDACELAKADTLLGNAVLPVTLANACAAAGVPWGHVSSGCIYSGAKIRGADGALRSVKDINKPEFRRMAEARSADLVGFTEEDAPNFSFRDEPCSFYSGTKALGEEGIRGVGQSYVWRLRIPFDEFDNARNYLTKVQRYAKVYDNVNSVSHRADFARACLDLWALRAPFGLYNVTNPGYVTTRQVVETLRTALKLDKKFEFWESDEEFYKVAAKTPRSNCVLDSSKLLAAGVKIRDVDAALHDSLKNWTPEKR